jgi:hypothetical protein
MKRFLLVALCWGFFAKADLESQLKNGDIIFIRSKSAQSKALEEVTASPWTHMGIVFKTKTKSGALELVDSTEEGFWKVVHSGGPVRFDDLSVFLGSGTKHSVKRLREGVTFEKALKLFKGAKPYADRRTPYDVYFLKNPSYCSGFVDLVFEKSIGVDLAKPTKIGDLKLEGAEAKKIMTERFSSKARAPVSIEEWKNKTTVTPVSIFNSPLLIEP